MLKNITFDEILAQKLNPLFEKKQKLEEIIERLKERKENLSLLEKLKEELDDIQKEIHKTSLEILNNALLIGTTLSKIAIDYLIYSRNYHTIILDEASMAPLPFVFWTSCLALDKIIITGDFRQLPPISIATTPLAQKWLKKDIFEQANIVQNYELGKHDPRLAKLTIQHRMHPQIVQLVNSKMYGNELKTHETTIQLTSKIANKEPFPNSTIILCDTSSINPRIIIPSHHKSRINIFHALLCCSLAQQALKNTQSIGIITPYNAQARLIAAILHDLGLSEKIKVATVHQFQGGEEDIIIYDTVDSPPPPLGKFSYGYFPKDNQPASETSKLLNVAITRAKGKFIIIANYSFLKQHLYPNAALLHILNFINQNGKVINPLNEPSLLIPLTSKIQNSNKEKSHPSRTLNKNRPLFQNLLLNQNQLPNEKTGTNALPEHNEPLLPNKNQLYINNSFQNQFLKSISTAQKHVIIFIPYLSENSLSQIEKYFSRLPNKNIPIFLITKTLLYPPKNTLEKLCQNLGIHLIYDNKPYTHLALIDYKECWVGTLDFFSENNNQQGITLSIKLPKTISLLYHFLDLNSLLHLTQNEIITISSA
jgi:hypothetical protein